MKHKYTLLFPIVLTVLILKSTFGFAQNSSVNLYNRWAFGLNVGATWQTNDMKGNKAGFGWGMTLGRYYLQNETHMFDIGWRFRYLGGVCNGQDYTRFYGIKNNVQLNGGNTAHNTNFSDTVNSTGYVFSNYKMNSQEFSFELQLGFNKLREKTGVLFYVFGGGGLFYYNTKYDYINNSTGAMYDFSTIDSTGSKDNVVSQMNGMRDNLYETMAPGAKNNKWGFAPTLGVGLGYQVSKRTAIGFEHKITFPMHDMLDGIGYNNDNTVSTTNDWYHYTSFFVRWTIGGRAHSTTTTDNTNYTTNPTDTHNTTTVVTNPPPPPPPLPLKPEIIITNPNTNPYQSPNKTANVSGYIKHVDNQNNVTVKINNMQTSNYTFNPSNGAFSINTMLNEGNNLVEISAYNKAGSDYKNQTLIYTTINTPPPPPPTPGPIVKITNPSDNPHVVNAPQANVIASVLNVASKSEIKVLLNNVNVPLFSYDMNTKLVTVGFTNLILGANIVTVSASNQYGSDSKSTTIIYQQSTGAKPIVTFQNPNTNPYSVTTNTYNVVATALNVDAQKFINVTLNGAPVNNFNFNVGTKAVTFTANLNTGNNIVTVTGSNNYGTGTASTTIIYQQALPKPQVTITNPSANPYNTSSPVQAVTATVINVAGQNEITVTVNGSPVSFNYNIMTKVATFTANLNQGSNTATVTASNQGGTDTKSTTIIYTPSALPKPVVTYVNPGTTPLTVAQASYSVVANVTNVTAQNQVTVTLNGNPVAFTFNNPTVTFTAALNLGANTVVITGTNQSGSDTKSTVLNYATKSVNNIPVNNPPTITITQPTTNPFNVTGAVCITTMFANVTGVTSSNDITVKLNGNTIAFQYDLGTKVLGFSCPLNGGGVNNTVVITATNPGGTATKSQTLTCGSSNNNTNQVNVPPTFTLINPSADVYISAVAAMAINLKVTGISNQNQITVNVNNVNVPNFTFNATTGVISFNVNLINGTNTILVNATNNIATGSQTITITYGTNGNKTNGNTNNPKNGQKGNNDSNKTTTNPKTTTTTKPNNTTTTTTTTTSTENTTKTTTTTTKTDSVKTTTMPNKTITKPK